MAGLLRKSTGGAQTKPVGIIAPDVCTSASGPAIQTHRQWPPKQFIEVDVFLWFGDIDIATAEENRMPLREHFRTQSTILNWEGLHAFWPSSIVARLNALLPQEYVARPRLQTGGEMELDVGPLESESVALLSNRMDDESGTTSVAWAPAAPTILLDAEFSEPSEYEVNIYTQDEFRLVAAIELVSPSNKDRPESRHSFVNKCEALLKKDVCVAIVDPVTSRTSNLYGELLDELGARRTHISRSLVYAVACRGRRSGPRWRLETWEHELAIGTALPTLPLWLTENLMVPLELESTYEDACRSLRIC